MILEEYKAQIVFTLDKRTIVGKKMFNDKSLRTFSHMMVASYTCKDGKFTLDREFRCDESNPESHIFQKIEGSNSRYSGQLPISHSNNNEEILDLHIEFDTNNFEYVFDLVRSVANLLHEEKDEIVFEIYLYFLKH